jgi:asparagine synthase (glutamine-hydrolysing)
MFADIRQQAVKNGSRVTLTGEGGDQWLQGSRAYYVEELAQGHWSVFLDCFRADVAALGFWKSVKSVMRDGFFPLLPPSFQSEIRHLVRRIRGNDTQYGYWLSPEMQRAIRQRRGQGNSRRNLLVRNHGQRELLEHLHHAFTDHVMEGAERLGASFGIEMRYPLRDPRTVQFALSLPERLRLRGDRAKYIHVQALRDVMPEIVLDRKSKAEFSQVFRAHLDLMEGLLTETVSRERPVWLNREGMVRLFQTYRSNPQQGWPHWTLWSIYGCHMVYK